MINLKNKKADSKLLSLWWFLVLIVIAVGIVIGVLIVVGVRQDIRIAESKILSDDIANCLTNQGKINPELNSSEFNIFSSCNLDENVISKSGFYYLEINIIDSKDKVVFSKIIGNSAFKEDCKLTLSGLLANKYPLCSENLIFVTNEKGESLKLNILAGSNSEKRSQNA